MISKDILQGIDEGISPGADFARFATGNWIKYNPKPDEYPDWGPFMQVVDRNIHRNAEMIQRCAEKVKAGESEGEMSQKIGNLYNMAMDLGRLNREGVSSLRPYLDQIEAIKTREDYFRYCTEGHRNTFWGIGIAADDKDSSMNILHIYQGGISLDRDYYLIDDKEHRKVYDAYRKMVITLLGYHGYEDAEAMTDEVLALEKQMAQVTVSRTDLRDPEKNYHKMSLEEISALTGGFDWAAYLRDYGYDQTFEANLCQIEPVALGCRWMKELPLELIRKVLIINKVVARATSLDEKCFMAKFEFNKVVTGQKEPSPRWKYASGIVNGVLAPVVGRQYVKDYFSEEAKTEAFDMIRGIQSAFAKRIRQTEWMSPQTREFALDKLSSLTIKVGYPDKWDDLSGLEIDPSKTYVDNLDAISKFFWNLRKKKYYNQPVDRSEWGMDPQEVNAYYNPMNNEICFPAAILQEPFFTPGGDPAQNYGMIGCVIAHEMTHGFDDEGRKFDKEGNLREWWSAEDVEAFKVPASRYVDYYNSLWVVPPAVPSEASGEAPSNDVAQPLHANGELTLGENIADLGGINIAYDAYRKAIAERPEEQGEKYTSDQRFFLSYAHVWATYADEALYRYMTTVDVHSVGYLRVNGPLPQIDAWYEAFGITPDDPMYLAPEARIRIW